MQEQVYEYIEEADKAQVMELMDAVINRFRELYEDPELVVMTLPVKDKQARVEQLKRVVQMMQAQM